MSKTLNTPESMTSNLSLAYAELRGATARAMSPRARGDETETAKQIVSAILKAQKGAVVPPKDQNLPTRLRDLLCALEVGARAGPEWDFLFWTFVFPQLAYLVDEVYDPGYFFAFAICEILPILEARSPTLRRDELVWRLEGAAGIRSYSFSPEDDVIPTCPLPGPCSADWSMGEESEDDWYREELDDRREYLGDRYLAHYD